MPAYLATVPSSFRSTARFPPRRRRRCRCWRRSSSAPLPRGSPVDARIERGRSYRHALERLLERENFDRVVVTGDLDRHCRLLRRRPGLAAGEGAGRGPDTSTRPRGPPGAQRPRIRRQRKRHEREEISVGRFWEGDSPVVPGSSTFPAYRVEGSAGTLHARLRPAGGPSLRDRLSDRAPRLGVLGVEPLEAGLEGPRRARSSVSASRVLRLLFLDPHQALTTQLF